MKTALCVLIGIVIILIIIIIYLISDFHSKLKTLQEEMLTRYNVYEITNFKADRNIHHELLKRLLPTIPEFEIEDYQHRSSLYEIKYKSKKDGLIIKAEYNAKTNEFVKQK